MMSHNTYFLLVDITTQKIADKSSFQRTIQNTCEDLNSKYAVDILYPLQITRGIQEISGAFNSIEHLYDIVNTLQELTHPQITHFVLCCGEIDNYSNNTNINQMEGPVMVKSRELMDKLKKTGLFFDVEIDNSLHDNCLKWQLNLILLIKNKWSPQKLNIVKEYEAEGNQQMVAQKIGITQQAVSKNLSTSMIKEIKMVENDLNQSLSIYNVFKQDSPDNDSSSNLTLNKWLNK